MAKTPSSSKYIIGSGEWNGKPERFLSRRPESFHTQEGCPAQPNRLWYIPSFQFDRNKLLDPSHPQNVVYLDGVSQGPYQDSTRSIYSLDHHGDCVSNVTYASCIQAMFLTRLGTIGALGHNVFINHLDQDSLAAAYEVLYADMMAIKKTFRKSFFKRLKPIINLEGSIDSHDSAGEDFLDQGQESLEENHRRIKWIFDGIDNKKRDPYALMRRVFRRFDEVVSFDEKISQVVQINALDEVPISKDKSFVCVIASAGDSLSVGKEIQRLERKKSHKCACLLFHDGRTKYTIKLMDFVSEYKLPPIFEALNAAETNAKISSRVFDKNFLDNGWGGGSNKGGAPRYPNNAGPFLGFDTIKKIVSEDLRRQTEENQKKRAIASNGNGNGNGNHKPVGSIVEQKLAPQETVGARGLEFQQDEPESEETDSPF